MPLCKGIMILYRNCTRLSSTSDPVQMQQPLKVGRAALRVSGASPYGAVKQRSVLGHVLIAFFRIVFEIVDFASKLSFFDDYAISYNCYMPLHNSTGQKSVLDVSSKRNNIVCYMPLCNGI